MKLSFFGAARGVTGSKHLLEASGGGKILLDCGLFQGGGQDYHYLNRHFGFSPSEIDHVILSHAHIDHSGLLPRLVAEGFRGTVWCTPGTLDLCEIMLYDSAFIQENDLKYVNERRKRRGEELLDPLYLPADVEQCLRLFQPVEYGQWQQIMPGVRFRFYDSGHIIGSAGIYLEYAENGGSRSLFFTGDIGRPGDLLLPAAQPFPQADYLICESTYGDRLHARASDSKERLFRVLQDTCVKKQGKLIIPAFSVDRTQEVVYLLDRLSSEGRLPPIPVYVDSPLSHKATMVIKKHSSYFNREILDYIKEDGDAFDFPDLHYISDVKQSKELNTRKGPCVIISASGMAEAGRIKHHLANNIEKESTTVLIVGYCSPSSLGGAIRRGDETVRIFGEEKKVNAQVEIMDEFSAHADYEEMLAYLSCQDPAKVRKLFLVHGEQDVQESFREKLSDKGFKHIEIPELTDTFDI
jgi:metallo-beta-lactamase family protein